MESGLPRPGCQVRNGGAQCGPPISRFTNLIARIGMASQRVSGLTPARGVKPSKAARLPSKLHWRQHKEFLGTDIRQLMEGRLVMGLICKHQGEDLAAFSVAPARPDASQKRAGEFYDYSMATRAFYHGNWDAARDGYLALTKAKDPWVRETALYMVARVDINAAQDGGFDEWGDYTGITGDGRDIALRAGEEFAAYLKAYPRGQYANSARGLQRRVLWFTGNRSALKDAFIATLRTTDVDAPEFGQLLNEVDNKLIAMTKSVSDLSDPLLIATWDLQQMRYLSGEDDSVPGHGLTAEDLAAQKPLFKGHEDLFAFLQANHAYYIGKDYRRVLELIPDAARQDSYSGLQFSRQMLRGMALARLGDKNEAGFWRDLIIGADPFFQRPLVELGLALNYERSSRLDAVFAKGSPITDTGIRSILLSDSAGPDILRNVVDDTDLPMVERRAALRALLWKDLSHGHYANFAADHDRLSGFQSDSERESSEIWEFRTGLDEFRSGQWSQNYSCPDIVTTAGQLARNKDNVSAKLCLGDFYRLNGFDQQVRWYNFEGDKTGLGSGPDQFPGKEIPRQALYQQIIANPRASADDRAYALYRAVWCYGPTGRNDCGGEDVSIDQRKAWFRELKTRYPDSRWATDLDVYW